MPERVRLPALVAGPPSGQRLRAGSFELLNVRHRFDRGIDWSFAGNGKLWTYQLCGFDYLLDPDAGRDELRAAMEAFARGRNERGVPFEPYPTSLRIINWVKFIDRVGQSTPSVARSLTLDVAHLGGSIEYHLGANHVIENAVALVFGGYALCDDRALRRGSRLLDRELAEQIRADGGHYERSTMYHALMLSRVLDAVNLLRNVNGQRERLERLVSVARRMLLWLQSVTLQGYRPLLQDAAPGVASSLDELLRYAKQLGVSSRDPRPEKDRLPSPFASGYARIDRADYSCIVDLGSPSPPYNPGHSHCDALSLVVTVRSRPVFVDPGVTTYERGRQRGRERSTASHNTVQVDDAEQSEMWDVFRVGRRARITIDRCDAREVRASHDGYRRLGAAHTRSLLCGEKSIEIHDDLGTRYEGPATARFHLHPDIKAAVEGSIVRLGPCVLEFPNGVTPRLARYGYSGGFNRPVDATVVECTFRVAMRTVIHIMDAAE